MSELGVWKDCFNEIPVRTGAIGIKRGMDGQPKEAFVNAYCWGDKILNAQLEAGREFSLQSILN